MLGSTERKNKKLKIRPREQTGTERCLQSRLQIYLLEYKARAFRRISLAGVLVIMHTLTVYACAAPTSTRWITALDHEIRNDAVEDGSSIISAAAVVSGSV